MHGNPAPDTAYQPHPGNVPEIGECDDGFADDALFEQLLAQCSAKEAASAIRSQQFTADLEDGIADRKFRDLLLFIPQEYVKCVRVVALRCLVHIAAGGFVIEKPV